MNTEYRPLIKIIVGSVRENSFSMVVAKDISRILEESKLASPLIIDPKKLELPMPGLRKKKDDVDFINEEVQTADGLIFITPEYNGSYSSVIKLIIEHLGYPSKLGKKPVYTVGVSAGELAGVIPLEHLRSVLNHTGAYLYPEKLGIGRVYDKFCEQGRLKNTRLKALLEDQLKSFIGFVDTFRQNEDKDIKNWLNGYTILN